MGADISPSLWYCDWWDDFLGTGHGMETDVLYQQVTTTGTANSGTVVTASVTLDRPFMV